jgi:phosphoserine phosphatase RsbU/P
VSAGEDLLAESAEDLFENAPCGYLSARPDGTIVKVNRTFESMTGLDREAIVGQTRFRDLLTAGSRIYHETHYAPLLQMQGSVREIALEVKRDGASPLPVLVNSTLVAGADGRPRLIRTTVFDASDRRRYEQELLLARRREQETAQKLQRSLLSGALPQAPGLELDLAYRPAVAGLEVGGDWYDAYWLEEGRRVGLVVGDVVGRGIEAAATMGQLRSAIRALASTGLRPGALLGALDGFAARHEIGRMATVVCAELELDTRRLRFACAGHPPPVIVPPGEPPHVAWAGRSVPLDCYGASIPRDEASCVLAPGTALLLYTDGLIERRAGTLSDGLDRLLATVTAHRDERVAGISAAIMRELRDTEHPDDVCLLTARLATPAIS